MSKKNAASQRWGRRGRLAIVVGAVVAFVPGCRDDSGMSEVTGTVSYDDGAPMQWGFVQFQPTSGGAPSKGVVQEDGTFELTTTDPGDGAPPGSYQVAVFPDAPADYDPDSGRRPPPTILQKYFSPQTSGLSYEVKASEANHFDITVERATR